MAIFEAPSPGRGKKRLVAAPGEWRTAISRMNKLGAGDNKDPAISEVQERVSKALRGGGGAVYVTMSPEAAALVIQAMNRK